MKIALIVAALMAVAAVHAEEVDIGGKIYYFTNTQLGADFPFAESICRGRNMNVIGFETMEEWDAVLNYTRSTGKFNYYWTNGVNLGGSYTWEWGSSGVAFDDRDSRWADLEPGNGPFDAEHVSFHVQGGEMYSDDNNLPNHVVCEAMA